MGLLCCFLVPNGKDAYDVEAVVTHWLITQDIGLYQEGIDKLILQCKVLWHRLYLKVVE